MRSQAGLEDGREMAARQYLLFSEIDQGKGSWVQNNSIKADRSADQIFRHR